MAIRHHLLNKLISKLFSKLYNHRGQILIESIFLVLVVTAILVVFKQLIEFQKSKKQYRFSKKETTHAAKSATDNAK